MKKSAYLSLIVLIFACESSISQQSNIEKLKDFNAYWYAGEAEITSYELEQVRYGEVHKGTSVLVFVTEPFSKSKQVKPDNWRSQSVDKVSVLKLNMTKKFLTGIYPYSMMMSTFTPVSYDQYPQTFKVTTSSQEWCGHTWMQLNLENESYRLKGFSYFESEGDVDESIKSTIVEDELWTRIRLNPSNLPTGEIRLLPSTFYLRLRHRENKAREAVAKLRLISESKYAEQLHQLYEIAYDDRLLKIYFEETFPYTILGWEETYMSGFGNPGKLTTKARKINTIKSSYWNKNSNADRKIREELGLSTN
ncbi:MAG: hypothetical protein GDA51_11595 [Ekhidna sp.]|nr:hypothetical protein [Ekhidna sp.]